MGTCYNRLAEAVLTSTHNLCFGAKKKKNRYTPVQCIPQFFYIKAGFKGVYITRTCFPDVRFLEQQYIVIRNIVITSILSDAVKMSKCNKQIDIIVINYIIIILLCFHRFSIFRKL